MAVTAQQKHPKNIQILQAFQRQYMLAKHCRIPRLIITYVISIGLPVILFFMDRNTRDACKSYFAAAGACWLVMAYLLSEYEKTCIKDGAAIQDKFDTQVFGMEWNSVLVTPPIPGRIIELSKNHKGPVDERWHGDLSAIPEPYDVAIAQRNTLEWDHLLRSWYARRVLWLLLALLGLEVLLGLINQVSFEDAMLLLLLPSISAYILGVREYKEHRDNVEGRKSVQNKIDQYITDQLKIKKLPEMAKLRQFQDATYILRKCPAVVPKFVSDLRHEKLQANNDARIEEFAKKINERIKK